MKVFNAQNAMPAMGASQSIPQLTFSLSIQRVIINKPAGELIDAKVGGNVLLLEENGKVYITTKRATEGLPIGGFQKGTTSFRLSASVIKQLNVLKPGETGGRIRLKGIPVSLGDFVDCYQLIV